MDITFDQIVTPQGAFLVGLICVIYLYIRVLRRMSAENRIKLAIPTEEVSNSTMSETEVERYSRHIMLREIGGQGQSKLRKAKVLVIGAGGLGSPVLSYLAAAGVGTIGVIDDDAVSLSNLQRQVLFDEDHLGHPKVFAVKDKIKKLNPFIEILPFNRRLTEAEAEVHDSWALGNPNPGRAVPRGYCARGCVRCPFCSTGVQNSQTLSAFGVLGRCARAHPLVC